MTDYVGVYIILVSINQYLQDIVNFSIFFQLRPLTLKVKVTFCFQRLIILAHVKVDYNQYFARYHGLSAMFMTVDYECQGNSLFPIFDYVVYISESTQYDSVQDIII